MSVYHEPDLSYDKRRTALITIAGLLLAVAVVACLYFFFNPRINAAPLNTTVAAITQNPKDMLGRHVVVPGRVVSVLNGSAFTIVDANMVAGSPILVVSRESIPNPPNRPTGPALLPGDNVSLAGQVRRYNPEDRVNGLDLTRSEYAPFNGQPFVIASAVAPPGRTAVVVTPPGASPTPTARTIPTQPVYTGQASPNDRAVQVQVIRNDAGRLFGQRVQVQQAVVTEVDSDRGFWIKGSAPERLFVVLGPGLDQGPVEWMVVIKSGQTVTVNGVVTELPTARTLRKKWKMTRTAAAELAKEQVYLFADGIYIQQR